MVELFKEVIIFFGTALLLSFPEKDPNNIFVALVGCAMFLNSFHKHISSDATTIGQFLASQIHKTNPLAPTKSVVCLGSVDKKKKKKSVYNFISSQSWSKIAVTLALFYYPRLISLVAFFVPLQPCSSLDREPRSFSRKLSIRSGAHEVRSP